jgi:ABC-type transport system involved in multi-copper enzyme maturation permease subunit
VNRGAYLGLLWILGLTAWQATIGWDRSAALGETARFGLMLFKILAYVQLLLLVFFAALSAASGISQEKDRRTFVLLLLTDLRNYEIVLGKLLGSVLQNLLLLAGVVPVLALLLLLGGIAPQQVGEVTLILGATALAAGSLGCLMALWCDKTFPALALTVLFLVLYLCLALDPTVLGALLLPALLSLALGWTLVHRVHNADVFWAAAVILIALEPVSGLITLALWHVLGRKDLLSLCLVLLPVQLLQSALPLWWVLNESNVILQIKPQVQSWFHPYWVFQSVLNPLPESEGSGTSLPAAYGYLAVMGLFSVLLNLWAIARLRVWNPSGEPIVPREQVEAEEEDKDRARAQAAPGPLRRVWANPILWREIATRAYGRRPLLVKTAYFLVLALVCLLALYPVLARGERLEFAAAQGLVPVGILSLLLLSAQAVTAITSERDTGALDLLLVTDLTPTEFIFGKLWGICYNAKEFLVPPLILAGIYAYQGLLATPPAKHPELLGARNTEALVCLLGAELVLMAFAVILGLHVALRTSISRLAIINTLGSMFFLSVGTLLCIYLILINRRFEYQWASFILFIMAGIGGLWWVLSGDRPSAALTLASWLCPLAVFYTVTNILVARPGTDESGDPVVPFLVMATAFGFTIAAMLIPLVSEFDVALGRTTAGGE